MRVCHIELDRRLLALDGPAGGVPLIPDAPAGADLRPGRLGGWSDVNRLRAMHEGRHPDDSAIAPFMPWPTMGKMSDIQLRALRASLRTPPPA
ncbi:hypothetical protein [Pseudomarimonas salicorniae]|uniref:Uncharacterized protein n=1 Tax=Pseudomarimonas salicorniae TaxID=2933270 RepID=A0ABT0GD65_9GAMM|nr:hypothetical protein [Lysobacter sp. CAU 1642]MCK7592491.1 hypothetical protein [Lysobacter sp. CAU 1642]